MQARAISSLAARSNELTAALVGAMQEREHESSSGRWEQKKKKTAEKAKRAGVTDEGLGEMGGLAAYCASVAAGSAAAASAGAASGAATAAAAGAAAAAAAEACPAWGGSFATKLASTNLR